MARWHHLGAEATREAKARNNVPLALLASHLAAIPRGLGRFEPIGLGAVWRDARRCDRSRVGSIGCSEIGVEGSIRQGGLRGFVGILGSPRGDRGRWDLTKSASADKAMSVCAPSATIFVGS